MPTGFFARWWTYQRERFPVFAHGILIAAFSSSAVCFSALLRGADTLPPWSAFLVAFVSSFIAFLHLRIADEFKDFEDDSRWRRYRAVPRGLVSLRELGVLAALGASIQIALAVWLDPWLLVVLGITWTYLILMSFEFFVRDWLKARPFTYMWTHMMIMPLIDFYATACDWLPRGEGPPFGLFLFVIVSFFNGMVVEVGRKLRAPEQEEEGVETYTVLWGHCKATNLWLTVMALTGLTAVIAGWLIHFLWPIAILLALLWVLSLMRTQRFIAAPTPANAKWFEPLAGVWTLSLYLILGAIPMAIRLLIDHG
ncbi:MAG: UbiA family prenyltransferase [Verrucomicrobiota bacterium]